LTSVRSEEGTSVGELTRVQREGGTRGVELTRGRFWGV